METKLADVKSPIRTENAEAVVVKAIGGICAPRGISSARTAGSKGTYPRSATVPLNEPPVGASPRNLVKGREESHFQ